MTPVYLVRTRLGVSDLADNITTRCAEETIGHSKMTRRTEFRREFKATLEGEKARMEEYDPDIFWPSPFAQRLNEACQAFNGNLVKVFKNLGNTFTRVSSELLMDFYAKLLPENVLRDAWIYPDREHRRFILLSNHASRHAILEGKQTVISRVLETDINWSIGPLAPYLDATYNPKEMRSRKEPLCLYLISPNKDPEHGIEKIAEEETRIINEMPGKKKALNPDRGISSVPYITALRHLRLHARTLAALYFLKKTFPQMVEVGFRRDVPDCRCTITHTEENVDEVFFVQPFKYEIGLDSNRYRAKEETFKLDMYKKTTDKQKVEKLGEDKILSEIETSAKIEERIVHDHNLASLEKQKAIEQGILLPAWWKGEPGARQITSYTIEDLNYNIRETKPKNDFASLMNLMNIISEEQKIIDQKLMPQLRKVLEE